MICKDEQVSSWAGHSCTVVFKCIALCHLTDGHSTVQARRQCMRRPVAVNSETSGNTYARMGQKTAVPCALHL